MIGKIIVLIFMGIVLFAGAWQFYLSFLGPGRTGNFLRIRKTGAADLEYGYRILSTYKFVLRRLAVYWAITLVFFLLTPFYFAIVLSLLLLLTGEWWRAGKGDIKLSMFSEWRRSGYKIRTLCGVIAAGMTVQLAVHFIFYPMILNLMTG